jgi:hypothetical protein
MIMTMTAPKGFKWGHPNKVLLYENSDTDLCLACLLANRLCSIILKENKLYQSTLKLKYGHIDIFIKYRHVPYTLYYQCENQI